MRTVQSRMIPVLSNIGVVLITVSVCLSQEPPDQSPTIALDAPPALISASLDASGKVEIGLRGTTAYGLRLDSESAGMQTGLLCTADPVVLKEGVWNRATGACRILISTGSAEGNALQIVRLNISRDPSSSSAGVPGGEVSQRSVEIDIAPPKAAAVSSGKHRNTILAVGSGLLLAVLVGSIFYLRRRRATEPDPEQAEDGEDSSEKAAGSEPAISYPTPVPTRGHESSSLPPPVADRSTGEDILRRLSGLEEQVRVWQQTATRQTDEALSRAVNDLGGRAGLLCDEARRLQSTVAGNLAEFSRLQSSFTALREIPPDRLSLLLSAAPATALAMRASPEAIATVAARFDSVVKDCVRDVLSVKSELEPMVKTLSKVLAPLDCLLEAGAKLQNRGLTDRLVEVRGEIRNMSLEVESALAGGADRVCLYFRLELSTLSGTEQSLTSELAGCLRRQLVRLADPVGYFGMRFELTIGQALQEVIDCCDAVLDPGRRVDAIQKQIAVFVAEADATLIEPRPGTPLLDNEHTVFGLVRCSAPADKPDHISALRVRGLKRRGQVLRKASVMVFS